MYVQGIPFHVVSEPRLVEVYQSLTAFSAPTGGTAEPVTNRRPPNATWRLGFIFYQKMQARQLHRVSKQKNMENIA